MGERGGKVDGCEHEPEGECVSVGGQVGDKCPGCGGRMVVKRGRKGEVWDVCVNEQGRHRVEVESGGGNDESDE